MFERRRIVLVLVGIVVVIAAFAVWRLLRPAAPEALVEVLDPGVPMAGSLPGEPSAEPTAPATVTVHVTGPVAHPGVVILAAGARVADAVAAAGGLLPAAGASSVNLARPLTDGEQLDLAAPVPSASTGQAVGGGGGGKVDLNRATAEQLDELPGVGPVLADKIIRYRAENGPFGSVEQLQEVPGIGASRLADLSSLVTTGAG